MNIVFWYDNLIDGVPSNPIDSIENTDRWLQRLAHKENYEFKQISVDQVNPSDKNFYIVSYYSPEIEGAKQPFDTFNLLEYDLLSHVKYLDWLRSNPEVTLIIDQSWEIHLWNWNQSKNWGDFLVKQKAIHQLWNEVIICRGMSKDTNWKTPRCKTIDLEMTWFITGEQLSSYYDNFDFNTSERPYLFQAHCAKPKIHRIALLTFLKQKNLLKKTNYSLVDIVPRGDRYQLDGIKYYTTIDNINNIGKRFINVYNLKDKYNFQGSIVRPDFLVDSYSSSYTSLVLESDFNLLGWHDIDNEKDFISNYTEKTLKSLFAGQFFIVVGLPFVIERLRELGFDVFDDIIDHRYDVVLDKQQRWDKIKETIMKFNKRDMYSTYLDNIDRLKENQNKFLQLYQSIPGNRLKQWLESFV